MCKIAVVQLAYTAGSSSFRVPFFSCCAEFMSYAGLPEFSEAARCRSAIMEVRLCEPGSRSLHF
jgi:hypothetical protein